MVTVIQTEPVEGMHADESGVSSGSGGTNPTLSEPRFYSLEVTSEKVQESLRVASCFPVYFLVG